MRTVTSAQMKQIEKNAAESGYSYLEMMESAGTAAVRYITEKMGPGAQTIFIYAGRGNNGGDGFVAARLLTQRGYQVKIILVEGEPRTEDARVNYKKAADLKINISGLPVKEQPDLIIDAIYGTGFHGTFQDAVRSAARQMNSSPAAVFSLDIPSGVNADTGERDRDAIRSDYTIAFDSLKPAHHLENSKPNCGIIFCADIGISDFCHEGIH